MTTIQVFDPALCCSTGVCGVDVDQYLVGFAACWRRLKIDHPYRLKIDQGELLNRVLYSIGIVDQTELVLPPFFY